MPMYPYRIPTRYGYNFPFDTESNVSARLPPNTLVSLHSPSAKTKSSGRTVIIQPVTDASLNAVLGPCGTVSLEEIAPLIGTEICTLENGASVIVGNPINYNDVADKKHITTMYLPGVLFPVLVIAVLIIAIAISLAAIVPTIVNTVYKIHALDIAMQAQQVVSTQYIDVDTGATYDEYNENCDIERRTYKNGEVLDLALNAKGKEWCDGNTAKTVREGTDFEDLIDTLEEDKWTGIIKWVLIGAVGLGAVVIAVKVVPSLLQRRAAGGEYRPPPTYYPPLNSRYR